MGFANRFALALTAAALAIAPQALRADQPAAISGIVLNKGDQPVAGATVDARSFGGTVLSKTDKDGRFAMLVPSGATFIVIRAFGHLDCTYQIQLNSGDTVQTRYRIPYNQFSRLYRGMFVCDQHVTGVDQYDRYVIQ